MSDISYLDTEMKHQGSKHRKALIFSRRVSQIAKFMLPPRDRSPDASNKTPLTTEEVSPADAAATGSNTLYESLEHDVGTPKTTKKYSIGTRISQRHSKRLSNSNIKEIRNIKTESATKEIKIGEPQLESASLMISDKSNLLSHNSSFRRSTSPPPRLTNNKESPKFNTLVLRDEKDENHNDRDHQAYEEPHEALRACPKDTEKAKESARKDRLSDMLKIMPPVSRRGSQESLSTLSGIQEKFDEIRAKLFFRDVYKPLPAIPTESQPLIPSKDMGDYTNNDEAQGDLLNEEYLIKKSSQQIMPIGQNGRSDHTGPDTSSFHSDETDQFIFEDYNNIHNKSVPYEARHRVIKLIDGSQSPELEITADAAYECPSTGIKLSHNRENNAGRSQNMYRSISTWRPGHLVSRAARELQNSDLEPPNTRMNRRHTEQTVSNETNIYWEKEPVENEHNTSEWMDKKLMPILGNKQSNSSGRIKGLPRLLPVYGDIS